MTSDRLPPIIIELQRALENLTKGMEPLERALVLTRLLKEELGGDWELSMGSDMSFKLTRKHDAKS